MKSIQKLSFKDETTMQQSNATHQCGKVGLNPILARWRDQWNAIAIAITVKKVNLKRR